MSISAAEAAAFELGAAAGSAPGAVLAGAFLAADAADLRSLAGPRYNAGFTLAAPHAAARRAFVLGYRSALGR